ncbi:MAG: GH1 family beta-glucosidase [Acutalibacteraceae bacterium]
MNKTGFREGFFWGASTAAYQVEGAVQENGKGLSVWDEFCRWPGKIKGGDSGDIACDQVHRYREDIALMKQIGLNAHRFSVSWPRVMPDGVGRLNEKGLDYYDRFIDGLLENGIEPFLTLFHWDYPYALYQKGGWLNPDSPEWFAEYAGKLAARYADRVKYWITQNEPQCFIHIGHYTGRQAPGLRLSERDCFRVLKHSQLAHGKAVQAMRAAAGGPIAIGIAPTSNPGIPATDSPADISAAREFTFAVTKNSFYQASLLIDPVLLGRYPENTAEVWGEAFLPATPEELKEMCQPLDFLGYNLYHGAVVKAGKDGPEALPYPMDQPMTANGWPILPDTLYWGPKFFIERYRLPFMITENGIACQDVVMDGEVSDPQRIYYLGRYLESYQRLAEEGCDLRGYFHWSLLDNFEWAEGFTKRFGLIYTDYATQQRIIKASGREYQRIIAHNGV